MRAHDTVWAVLFCLVCVFDLVSPQQLVATNDDGPPHAAPPSPHSPPPPSPSSPPAHPPPPMAATPNATALSEWCTTLATQVFTECSAIPGRYVRSDSISFQCCVVYPDGLPTHKACQSPHAKAAHTHLRIDWSGRCGDTHSAPCCGAIHSFLDDHLHCICHEPAVRGLVEQADVNSVQFVSRACRMDLSSVITHQLEECDAAIPPSHGFERAAVADPLRHIVGLTPAMRRASGSVEKAAAGVSQVHTPLAWPACTNSRHNVSQHARPSVVACQEPSG
jgi:hypothetical protein